MGDEPIRMVPPPVAIWLTGLVKMSSPQVVPGGLPRKAVPERIKSLTMST
jgi:hypothetical protein